MFEDDIERGAEHVAIVGMQHRQPVAGRALKAGRRQAEQRRDVGTGYHTVAQNVPVPHDVAGADHGQRLALEIAEQTLMHAGAGQCVLHDGEADQQNDEHQATAEGRLHDVVVQHAGDRQPSAGKPSQHHQPTGY